MTETPDKRVARLKSQLAAAPRHVPFVYRLVLLNFNLWFCFAVFFLFIPFPAFIKHVPVAGLAVGLAFFSGFLGWKLRQAHIRHVLLRWGAQADVTGSNLLSQGTYYSGAVVQNTRMSQAHGWTVTRKFYSGPISRTRIDYRLNGTSASMVLRGLTYEGGVVLADTRKPSRALCVSSFPYDIEPDSTGNWPGKVKLTTLIGTFAMAIYLGAWGGGIVAMYLHYR